MSTLTPNYGLIVPEGTDTVEQVRADYVTNLNTIDGIGGGGSGGHTIVNPSGTDMPAESKLQFTGGVTVTDDSANNKTVVNITGGGGSNLIIDAQIYSDTEKVVGIWRDGKPLYQKTIPFTASSGSYQNVATGIVDFDTIFVQEAFIKYANGEAVLSSYKPTVEANEFVGLIGSSGSFDYRCGTNLNGGSGSVTLRYTKITDVAGSGGYEAYGFSPVIYSDTERVVGVWRDNKPLYQKTVNYGSIPTGGASRLVAHGISNIETLANAVFTIQNGTQFRTLPNVARSSADHQTLWYMTATEIGVIAGSNADVGSGYTGYVTLQYTKTTDVAGSGDYNTLGIPTVHYSTSEQVIGTWIDGKPLYQKSFRILALPSTAYTNTSYPHGISNFKELADIEIIVNTGSSYLKIDKQGYTGSGYAPQYSLCLSGVNSSDVVLLTGTNRSSWSAVCTLKYTKTTDT